MGLFSNKKTFVSSSCYNLAGDVLERPNYMKTTVIGGVIGGDTNRRSMGEVISEAYMKGPGIKMRSYFRWADNNHYPTIGIPGGVIGGTGNYVYSQIAAELSSILGMTDKERLWIVNVFTGSADYAYWADQYMLENHPELVETNWISEFDEDSGNIVIIFEDLSTVTFTPTNFNKTGIYLYILYGVVTSEAPNPDPIYGDWVFENNRDSFPSISGWTYINTYSEIGNLSTEEYEIEKYSKSVYGGTDPANGQQYNTYSTLYLRERMEGTTTDDPSRFSWSQTDEKIYIGSLSNMSLHIYKLGTGNSTFDQLTLDPNIQYQGFLPFIPIRHESTFLSEEYLPVVYADAKKAFKKLTGTKMSEIVDRLSENENLDDIDFAYVLPSVPLNTPSNTGREYLYRFFDKMKGSQPTSQADYTAWSDAQYAYNQSLQTWIDWKIAQEDPGNPLYGEPEPTVIEPPQRPTSFITIKSNGTAALANSLVMRLSWQLIKETSGAGLKKPGAKKGEYWLEILPDPQGELSAVYTANTIIDGDTPDLTSFAIHHQIDEDNWESLEVIGAVHENLIYNGKGVVITGKDALLDNEDSGFLVPLHYQTTREMSLVDFTQMSLASNYLVLNSYKVVKLKWYQTGFFKVLIVVIIIALVAIFPPSGSTVGLLGTAASVGAAIGATGALAVILGTIINAIAAMLLMKLISIGAVALFGEKLGAIIGTIASFAAMSFGTGLMNGQSLSSIWGSMGSATGILQMTTTVANGASAYMQADVLQTVQKTQDLLEKFQKETKELRQKYQEEFGNRALLDPARLAEMLIGNSWETMDAFLERTLMTGSDIAQMSQDMISGFTDNTLNVSRV